MEGADSDQNIVCKICSSAYDMNYFSKTQINKLLHKKILASQLTCKACVSVLENQDIQNTVNRKKAEEERQQKALLQQQTEQAAKGRSKVSKESSQSSK